MEIVNLFYELAKQHEQAKGFAYGKLAKKGSGNDLYPLVWVDDPLSGSTYNSQERGSIMQWRVNVDFLGVPEKEAETLAVQNMALQMALHFFERFKNTHKDTGVFPESYSWITLREYNDDNAAGVRMSYTLNMANPIDRCLDPFDPTKEFPKRRELPDFVTENPEGCAVLVNSNALPDFKLPDA